MYLRLAINNAYRRGANACGVWGAAVLIASSSIFPCMDVQAVEVSTSGNCSSVFMPGSNVTNYKASCGLDNKLIAKSVDKLQKTVLGLHLSAEQLEPIRTEMNNLMSRLSAVAASQEEIGAKIDGMENRLREGVTAQSTPDQIKKIIQGASAAFLVKTAGGLRTGEPFNNDYLKGPLHLRPKDRFAIDYQINAIPAHFSRAALEIEVPADGVEPPDNGRLAATVEYFSNHGGGKFSPKKIMAESTGRGKWLIPLSEATPPDADATLDIYTDFFTVLPGKSPRKTGRIETRLVSEEWDGQTFTASLDVDDRPHITDVVSTRLSGTDQDQAVVTVKVKDFNGCASPGMVSLVNSTGQGTQQRVSYIGFRQSACVSGDFEATYVSNPLPFSGSSGINSWYLLVEGVTGKPNEQQYPFNKIDYPSRYLYLSVNDAGGPAIDDLTFDKRVGLDKSFLPLRWRSRNGGAFYKIVRGLSDRCDGALQVHDSLDHPVEPLYAVLTDWTPMQDGAMQAELPSGVLPEGFSVMTLCVASSERRFISRAVIPVIRDTTPIDIDSVSYKAAVESANADIQARSNKPGWFRTQVKDGQWSDPTPYDDVGRTGQIVVENQRLELGSNPIKLKFTDLAGNEQTYSGPLFPITIKKLASDVPSMRGQLRKVTNPRIGADGTIAAGDFIVEWKPVTGGPFNNYCIFIVPDDFSGSDINSLSPIAYSAVQTESRWQSRIRIFSDSLGHQLKPDRYNVLIAVHSGVRYGAADEKTILLSKK